MKEIGKEEVRDLMKNGAQLVEVLSAKSYAEVHLAGARNIPLDSLDQQTIASLDQDQPVITYCHDFL